MTDEFGRLNCAFCDQDSADDPQYVNLELTYAASPMRQSYGAHFACLKAALAPKAANSLVAPIE